MTRHIVMVVALAAAACGGPDKPANSASSDCPPGTQKQGGDCVAPDEESGPGQSASMESHGSGGSSSSAMATSGSGGGGGGSATPAGPKTPYDKDAVEMVLRRAANQVKANCGAATDNDGKATGPWGATKVSVTLGRNGHVHDVAIPDPYSGKPAGKCASLAFQNLIYPPYPGAADAVVDWDVEIVKPANVK
jgi:hypothetical protein